MRRLAGLCLGVFGALIAPPPASCLITPPPPRLGPAEPPPRPVVLAVPKRFNIDPQAPRLTAAENVQLRLWKMNLARQDNLEAMYVLRMAAEYYTHPFNQLEPRGVAPEYAREMFRGAVRAKKYESGNYTPPPLIALPGSPLGDPIAGMLRGSQKDTYLFLRDKAKGELGRVTKAELEKLPRVKDLMDRATRLNPYLDMAEFGNKWIGARMYETLPLDVDRRHLRDFEQAMTRTPEGNRLRPLREVTPEGTQTHQALARLIVAARTDPNVRAILTDLDPLGAQGIPNKSLAELGRDPRFANLVQQYRLAQPEAGRSGTSRQAGPGAARPLTDREQKQVRVLTQALQKYREENRKLAVELRAARALPAETAEANLVKLTRIEALTQKRLEVSRNARQAAGLALECLSNLGVDPGLVRDLSTLTNASFQIGDGIITLAAGASNPLGWLSILSGLTSLFSFGPNPQQMILEQLAEIRRELAEFRHEVRLQFTLVREEMRDYTQKILDRVEDMEYHLARQSGEVLEQARWNEYRLQQVEGQLAALSHQILTRFAELHQKDLVTLLASRDLNRKAFAALDRADGRSELLAARFHDGLAATYAAAVHHAASRTLAGGDFEVPSAYGTTSPRLAPGGPGRLLPLVQQPAAPYSIVGDLAGLARSTGIVLEGDDDRRPREASGATAKADKPTFGTKAALSYPPDRTRLVNPMAWSLAAGAFLDLATDCPAYFRGRPDYVRGLVEVYRRGEEFNDAVHRIAAAPDGGVFSPLIDAQLKAIDRLEAMIKADVQGVANRLGGLDPWGGAAQPLPDGKYVNWGGSSAQWREPLAGQGFDMSGGSNTAQELPFVEDECKRLVVEKLIPAAFCLAGRIRPEAGRGPSQTLFGGSIELRVVNIELPDDHIRHRGRWRESTGFLGTGPGKYHHYHLYEGPAYVTFEARYRTPSNAVDYPIFRKRVPTRDSVRFFKEDERTFFHFKTADELRQVLEMIRWFEKHFGGGKFSSPNTGFQVMPFVASQWAGLKADLFNAAVGTAAPAEQLMAPGPVEKAIQDRLAFEAFDVEAVKDDALKNGLRAAGEAVREVVGCQATLYRFVQLALPEASEDRELTQLLVGDDAAWGGTAVMRRFRPKGDKDHLPLVVIQPAKDKDPAKVTDVPLTRAMRAQSLKLQARLAEVLGRRQAQPDPVRHPVVEGQLLRLIVTAQWMGIDLEHELREAGVVVPKHWACRQVNQFRAQLDDEETDR